MNMMVRIPVMSALIVAAPLSAAAVSFGGVFGKDAPASTFSKPQNSFDVTFDVPDRLPKNGNAITVTYQTAGKVEQAQAFLNFSNNPAQRQSITLSLGDPFSASALNIVFFSDTFFTPVGAREVRLNVGRYALYQGRAVATSLLGATTGSIVNPTGLRISKSLPVKPR